MNNFKLIKDVWKCRLDNISGPVHEASLPTDINVCLCLCAFDVQMLARVHTSLHRYVQLDSSRSTVLAQRLWILCTPHLNNVMGKIDASGISNVVVLDMLVCLGHWTSAANVEQVDLSGTFMAGKGSLVQRCSVPTVAKAKQAAGYLSIVITFKGKGHPSIGNCSMVWIAVQ